MEWANGQKRPVVTPTGFAVCDHAKKQAFRRTETHRFPQGDTLTETIQPQNVRDGLCDFPKNTTRATEPHGSPLNMGGL